MVQDSFFPSLSLEMVDPGWAKNTCRMTHSMVGVFGFGRFEGACLFWEGGERERKEAHFCGGPYFKTRPDIQILYIYIYTYATPLGKYTPCLGFYVFCGVFSRFLCFGEVNRKRVPY